MLVDTGQLLNVDIYRQLTVHLIKRDQARWLHSQFLLIVLFVERLEKQEYANTLANTHIVTGHNDVFGQVRYKDVSSQRSHNIGSML